jgi:hypothetical protein
MIAREREALAVRGERGRRVVVVGAGGDAERLDRTGLRRHQGQRILRNLRGRILDRVEQQPAVRGPREQRKGVRHDGQATKCGQRALLFAESGYHDEVESRRAFLAEKRDLGLEGRPAGATLDALPRRRQRHSLRRADLRHVDPGAAVSRIAHVGDARSVRAQRRLGLVSGLRGDVDEGAGDREPRRLVSTFPEPKRAQHGDAGGGARCERQPALAARRDSAFGERARCLGERGAEARGHRLVYARCHRLGVVSNDGGDQPVAALRNRFDECRVLRVVTERLA